MLGALASTGAILTCGGVAWGKLGLKLGGRLSLRYMFLPGDQVVVFLSRTGYYKMRRCKMQTGMFGSPSEVTEIKLTTLVDHTSKIFADLSAPRLSPIDRLSLELACPIEGLIRCASHTHHSGHPLGQASWHICMQFVTAKVRS
jgi:hypothetical protein